MSTIQSERAKYEKVYQYAGYGAKGHGVPIAGYLLERAVGRGLLGDFGCGRGGSFQPYIDAGFQIQPVDHVAVLDSRWLTHEKVNPLVVSNLWAGPLPVVDYGICTDVAEHIPEEHVDDMVANIAQAVRYGCLWSVCHVPDVWGPRIGEILHMTVRDTGWWADMLRRSWCVVQSLRSDSGTTVYWTAH